MTLFEAIHNDSLAFVIRYLKGGGDPNLQNEMGSSLLHEAVYAGSLEMIRQLLRYGAEVNTVDAFGNTPMHVASIYGRKDAAYWLLQYSAHIDATTDHRPWTPLMLALNEGHHEMAQWLINQGADMDFLDPQQGWTPFLVACEQGMTDFSLDLIRRGARVDVRLTAGDAAGKSAIHLASYYGEVAIIRALVEEGVDINQIPEGGGLGPLHWCVYNHHQELFDYLLEMGADVNIQATGLYYSRTPLHFAVSGDRAYMTRRLLEMNADPLAKDQEGRSPLDIALDRFEESGLPIHEKVVLLLEKHI